MKLGIDFGTSFSLPATTYLDQHIVLLPGGKYGIPSVFYYSDWDGVLIGEEAEEAGQGSDAKNLKREINLELNSTYTADGKKFTAKLIVGYILNCVKQNAITTAKAKLINSDLEGVVISVPAAFEHNEKEFIKEAAEIPTSQGGPELNVLGFIKEPVAAALAYFNTSLADKTKVLVYDLGGGTCDIAIVEANSATKEKYTVIDSDMLRIGGKNWDAKLETYIIHELEKQTGISIAGNPGYREKIKRAAISAKHSFSEKIGNNYRDKVRARVEVNGRTYQIPLTKAIFDELTLDLLNKTIAVTKNVLNRNNANDVSRIICVGGSSNMPQVQEGLKRAFPDKTIQMFEPEKAIAIGAAIYAQFCDGKPTYLSDIAAFSYGTDCYGSANNHNDIIVVNLIKRGDRLPITQDHGFITIKEGQTKMYFDIIENPNAVDQYDYVKGSASPIMRVVLEFPYPVPKGTSARLHITLTTDGIIEVTADDYHGHTITAKKQLNY